MYELSVMVGERMTHNLIEIRQTTLAEFDIWFSDNIKTIDDAVAFWKDVEKMEGLLQVQKGRYLRNIDRYIDGGLNGFCERIELARPTAYYFINIADLADDEKVSKRLDTLGPSKTAMIERVPEPERIYKWIDEQEETPSHREIKEKIVDIFKPSPPDPVDGEYDVIVIDPPWPLTGSDEHYEAKPDRRDIYVRMHTRPYPRMSIEEIQDMILPAADDCILWLWTTNMNLHNAFHVLERWGFTYRSCLTWAKPIMGLGYWLRGQTEHCLLATKGSPTWTNTTHRTLLNAERREDSRKPDAFYIMVEHICKGRKIDIFAREKRDDWDIWGDETDKF